jgi:membrane-bound serine protease (ClpP class)
VANAPIPIGIWVGPSGARFYGTAAQLLAVADVTGMSPGSRVGYTGVPLDPPGLPDGVEVDFGIAEERLRNGSVGLSDARTLDVFKQRIDDEGIPTISNMLQAMDGYEENGVVLVTTQLVVLDDGSIRFDTVSVVRFQKLPLIDQLFHTVASPPVAYLLLLIGLALLVFEFFTAGVGLAGGIGAISTVLAFTGLAVLPTNAWAVALVMLAMLAFAVDVQVGIPRFWTGVGIVLTIVGSWFLFDPVPGSSMRPGWLALIAGIGGIILTFTVGMPSMVRTRFATPTIGREWMIGQEGVAVEAIDPEGIVEVDGARWRARTNRATPIAAGDPLRVAAIDGVTLDVEPLEGAARDYREMRKKAPADAEPSS